MSVIETKEIKKIYNPNTDIEVRALDGVNLQIEEGEFTTIVGSSGSGKTTLLNIIGGLDKPSSGVVRIGDTEINSLKENQLIDFRLNNIGFVFQAYNLIPVLTAKENTGFIQTLLNITVLEFIYGYSIVTSFKNVLCARDSNGILLLTERLEVNKRYSE